MWTEHAIALIAIVPVLALVQSVFGVGLLLFGTPILLLLSDPFAEALTYLLPCSITVSVLQVATTGGVRLDPMRRGFLAITAPALLVATSLALTVGTPRQMKLVVGVVLLATALSRLGRARRALARIVRRHRAPLLLTLGVVHGLSNLGGGILTVLVGASFDDKETIRRQIAFAYGLMAVLQLTVVLVAARPAVDVPLCVLLPCLAGGVFVTLGQRSFRVARERTYQVGLTALIASFGAILVSAA
jgi:hypothetical protein